jgi:hypothetical protein
MTDDKYEALQEIGKGAHEAIADMVAALECDYERLEELRELKSCWSADTAPDTGPDELTELETAAGDCESRDDAERRIQEDPLSIEMRGDWYGYDTEPADAARPVEFLILLGTGGPAIRIIGDLYDGHPCNCRLQAQDWGTAWTDYRESDQTVLEAYCSQFYFGEG